MRASQSQSDSMAGPQELDHSQHNGDGFNPESLYSQDMRASQYDEGREEMVPAPAASGYHPQ